MSFKHLLPALLLLFVFGNATAQHHPTHIKCRRAEHLAQQQHIAAKGTAASPEQDKYDIKHVKLDLSMNSTSTALGGNATTTAQVVAASLSAYVFELDTPMVVDSVKINGALRPYTSFAGVHTVSFASALTSSTMFSAQVFYHNVAPGADTTHGIYAGYSATWGKTATYTDSQPYDARGWWPCKQALLDRIDSVDIWVTVDDSLRAASNGVLKAVTTVAPGRVRYEWKEKHSIVYYLVSIAVADYIDHSYYMHFTGSPDTMLVQNYVYNNPTLFPTRIPTLDSTEILINFYSDKFGRYPFWNEKYGHATTMLGGGMENQTMSTVYDVNDIYLNAHELAHQWFGNSVSCGSWSDIAMSEGFASYCTELFDEYISGTASLQTAMGSIHNWAMSVPNGSVYTYGDTSYARIFDSRLSYSKAEANLHLLRHVLDNDAAFFTVLRDWATNMANTPGTIAGFGEHVKTITGPVANGVNIDTLFKQWYFLEGFPIYTIKWNKVGNDVFVLVEQMGSAPLSVPFFKVPLELQLRSTAGDTVVRVLNDQSSQFFHFTWDRVMNSLRIDPNNWLMQKHNSITKDITLVSVGELTMSSVSVSPNPTSTGWQVNGLPVDCSISLSDVTGRLLYTTTASGNTEIPAYTYSPGIYILRIGNAGAECVLKLVKQ